MTTTLTALPARIRSVSCNLHPHRPEPAACRRCHTATQISLRLEHERGECAGKPWCEWCAMGWER
jgi:hypothetical protein